MRNSGAWTEARFRGFIKSALRNASLRWPPRIQAKKNARVERGFYLCAGYKQESHVVPATLPAPPGRKRRIDNALVDHILPVVDVSGFTTWDEVITRLFCEEEDLQVLCHECHAHKTRDEKTERTISKVGS